MDEMREESLAVVRQGAPGPVAAGRVTEARQAYMRYAGQGHEIAVTLPPGPYTAADAGVFRERFEAAYRRLYGRTIDGIAVEALSWTLTITAATEHAGLADAAEGAAAAAEPFAAQALFDPASGRPLEATVVLRDALAPGARIDGPALITEAQTTTVVAAGWRATVDAHGHLVLERTR
jgi:N-methylhydantoinase A